MKRPMRFLHMSTFYPPYSFGGDAMYLYRLCHALADEGHEVHVVHCTDAYHLLHPGEPEIAFAEHPGVIRHELRSGKRWLSPLITQQSGRLGLKSGAVQRLLDDGDWDVIHLHNVSLLGPELMSRVGQYERSVRLYMTHEHWLVCPNHVLWKFNERACEAPDCLSCVLRAQRPPQLWRYTGLLERSSRGIHRFVSPSRFTARMHAERGFARPVGHLPYFIERADEDWRDPSPAPNARPYFLFVGRLEKIKGLQTVLPLWDRVPDADLLIAGSGPYRAELERLAAGDPRVRFLGPMPQRKLGNLYFHALATIVPSITYETFGIIILESLARKTPVVVRDLGALPEVVEESGGGWVFDNDDQLVDILKQLVGEAGPGREVGERGYRRFVKLWTTEAHLKQYHELIDDVAAQEIGVQPWREREA